VSSGGTSAALAEAGIAHLEVATVTGAPEMLDGRVKTLHPAIHGGILADRSRPSHVADLSERGIEPIDLVVCNLYPFASAPSIEMIDVGGPTMLRAAAKNHAHVGVVVDPGDYADVLDELRRDGALATATRRRLARAAFAHSAAYDATIVTWFDAGGDWGGEAELLPPSLHLALERREELRYGENPHQRGARYADVSAPRGEAAPAAGAGRATGRVATAGGMWDQARQLSGRELSYLNLFDADAAWRLAHELLELCSEQGAASAPGRAALASAAVIVKHANACGAALGTDLADAYARAFEADPLSAFGGVVALPGRVDLALGEVIIANPLADVLIAAAVDDDAAQLLAAKRKNMRVLIAPPPAPVARSLRQIGDAWLVQDSDTFLAVPETWRVVTKAVPSPEQWLDLELAWRVCARTASNAIVLAEGGRIVGVGCGQQSRVDAAVIAGRKAAGRAEGGAAASDAYFPFRDGLDAVADTGVTAVAQPGGSLRDDEMIAAADERGLAMVLTGERHFRH
ncbi:MAG TPA: bifunctional phosphoribosylaminoimidazolecarboxamide formyltransferase/IMP cyclohydrolase, partial [Acidimicrobiales bacterium]|nr:bifunctional phosphoribosylaminoimidazolecarboxamide formyltransferase/IMP cyclohydrolase [Acidimicrobiales bacterium]